jgi:FMN phosphatase YigB (HAD superfamily)
MDRKGDWEVTVYIITLLNTLIKVDNAILDKIANAKEYFNVDIDKYSPHDDIYYLEELSYKGRVFIATNLSTRKAYEILNRYNVDCFVTRVISAEIPRAFTNNEKFFNYIYNFLNIRKGEAYFITANNFSINVAKAMGMKVVYIDREGKKSSITSLRKFLEINSKHYVDEKMGDSALRCR